MATDELLQSKYDRLCLEFKKLRTKHRELREAASKESSELQQLREKQKAKELLVITLQKECEELRFKNASLCQKLRTEEQLGAVSVTSKEVQEKLAAPPSPSPISSETDVGHYISLVEKGCSSSNGYKDSVEDEINSELVLNNMRTVQATSPKVLQDAKRATASELVATVETETLHQTSDDLSLILKDLSCALRGWTDSISAKSRTADLTEVHQALVDRITDLERQVCELSVQCQLERKRRLMNSEAQNHPEETNDSVRPTDRLYESLVIDGLQERIRSLTDQAQYFAGLATFLQDEIHCLTPKVMGLAHEACFYRTEATKARALIQKMRRELDQANFTTLRQSNEMANHIANLTDELQELRGGLGRNNLLDPTSKKNSIFSVLKR